MLVSSFALVVPETEATGQEFMEGMKDE